MEQLNQTELWPDQPQRQQPLNGDGQPGGVDQPGQPPAAVAGDGPGAAGETEAENDLLRRIDIAVATLGQMATAEAETEADIYPWADAVRWRPDDGWADELELPPDEGVRSAVLVELFTRIPDAQTGSREDMGWCGLLRHEGRPGGIILHHNQYGRRWGWATNSDEELAARWEQTEREHQAFEAATRSPNDGPSIWVGSL